MRIDFIKDLLFFAAVFGCIVAPQAFSSPAACMRNDASMFLSADTVVEVEVINSRRWNESVNTVHLVAKYRILDVFKGDVQKKEIVIVTDSCLDIPVPEWMIGYPGVSDYCNGQLNLNLTGVSSEDGSPVLHPDGAPGWILIPKTE